MDVRKHIINQIASIIVNDKKAIITVLQRNNIELDDTSDLSVINAVIGNIYDNTNFQNDLDNLIKSKKEKTSNVIGAIITVAAAAVGTVFKFITSAKDKKAQEEADRLALIQAILENKAAKEANNENYTALYVILALVVVGGLIGTYFLLKQKS